VKTVTFISACHSAIAESAIDEEVYKGCREIAGIGTG
jgi:hypothetical protein